MTKQDPSLAVSIVIEPVAVERRVAASMLGMSLSSFERSVQPHIRLLRTGRLRLVPVEELRAWVRRNARAPLASESRR